ncbi:type 1 glutamine amidotransferase domain-containing protein [Stackebrandtia nassauensis]|uniref:ThiJ/PfpI domain protein n=1 Tax=Stackebrandtia nassauensis (strain DSM 44728 / CIP 108903 / NRRL B-16338 / NBRC 102104 / LLR-40K-21) TaxID=446470 RepID=D3PWC3_STANL|nr:type 1 glutamine amidotransferase domain-containing protein [Stackebrandtia nassauensis]ADD41280.1 ThiJ/PfpI domain protein [Stackebrandtia nassauensis DSM 44728]
MTDSNAILMVLTGHSELGETGRVTGFHVAEAAYPWKAFTEAGYRVDFATSGTGTPTPDSADRSDPTQRDFLDDAGVLEQLADPKRPLDIDAAGYKAIFYVGGHGTMWDFPNDTALSGLARDIYEAGGVVAAICHGPAGLVNVKLSDGSYLVDGKSLTSFTDSEERAVKAMDIVPFALESTLVERGAHHTGMADFTANTVVDDRLVTGQNPASAPMTAAAVVEVLERLPGGTGNQR